MVRDHAGFAMTFPSHTTRLLMPNDNGYSGRFEKYWHLEGGKLMQAQRDLPHHEIVGAIWRAHQWAKLETVTVKVDGHERVIQCGEHEFANVCGIAPFDRSVSARRQSREKQEEEQRRQRHNQTSQSAPAKAGVQSTRTYQQARNLENKLRQVVLQKDFAVADRITCGVVQHDDGQQEEISQEEYVPSRRTKRRRKRGSARTRSAHKASS